MFAVALRTETIKPVLFPVLSAWHADLSFGHVCGAGAGRVLHTALMVCIAIVKTHAGELVETEADISREGLGRV